MRLVKQPFFIVLHQMSRFHSYINSAEKIIGQYNGMVPFAIFIKQFFATEKKFGSNDRKQIASLCFNYFRLGSAVKTIPVQEKIIIASLLCNQAPSAFMNAIKPGWNEVAAQPLSKKIALAENGFSISDIFPFQDELSESIDQNSFSTSMLVQPDTFARIRPSGKSDCLKKIETIALQPASIHEYCLQFKAGAKLEDYFEIDKELVVQDFNSQKVLDYLKENGKALFSNNMKKEKIAVWDCCAASGGKSILLFDILQADFNLTVCDKRTSILKNLQQRFNKAGIKKYQYFVADIGNEDISNKAGEYDIILCDAPCSGSGTWSRSPEQLTYFDIHSIDTYQQLQKKIVSAVLPHLKTEGLFFYITCSVFKKENEQIADFIEEDFGMRLLEKKLLTGYDKKSDTMFVAVFKKAQK